MDVVIITPEPGRQKEIGQKLLALADSPRDVQWVTWPSAGYSIPLELFAKFDVLDGEDGNYIKASVDTESLAAATDGAEVTLPQPKRRRRSKEVTESTDNNTSEEE